MTDKNDLIRVMQISMAAQKKTEIGKEKVRCVQDMRDRNVDKKEIQIKMKNREQMH